MKEVNSSLMSLLNNTGGCCYNIYYVVNKSFPQSLKDELKNIVKKQDGRSFITFLETNSDFDCSSRWKTPAIYYRLMLPHLLHDLDKIIYADVNTIFHDNLMEIDQIDLGGAFIAGVKDIINVSSIWNLEEKEGHFRNLTKGEYINPGFLIMNLKELRAQNLYEKWLSMSMKTTYKYPDQDILNHTCEGRKLFLPLKYNLIPQVYTKALLENIYPLEEYNEAISQPVMIHYAGQAKQLLS